MRDPTVAKDAKQIASASASASHSPSPRPYPVSIRAYKKKDYDYLSSFPRMAHSGVLRATHSDAELLQERSDCNSDLSMTASSVGYATSISSASSTSSSAQSFAKNVIASMDAEGHYPHQHQHHHQQQQHQHHFLSTQTCSLSPRTSVDCTESGIDMQNDTIDDRSSADVKDEKLNITGDSPDLIDEKGSAQVKEPVRSQSKPKPRPSNTPAVLPKFGSWDTRNPSSGEAYTLIFRRLRDEKKSGGLPVCTSPTHSKEEGTEQFLSQESKAKEALHSNKDSSRWKAKGKSHQEAAYNQKHATRWNFCCKASVLDD